MAALSFKTAALHRISKLVDKELESSKVFRRTVDKPELMESCSKLMDKKVDPEELLSIPEEELTQRIRQMIAGRVLGTLL